MAAPDAGTAPARLRRVWFAAGLALVAAVVWLSLAPLPAPPGEHTDKLEHLVTYAFLMLWFAQLGGARRGLVAAAALVALGAGIELLQALTPYRRMDPADMVANALGVALGLLAAPPRTPNVLERLERRFGRRAAG
ncbi:MAG: VanZ family protein [Burkholderiales bacterium]|nr:VanZ family protein [Burkholderiales bacterium]